MYGRLEGPRLARPAAEPPRIRQDRPRPLEHVHTTPPQPYPQPQPQSHSHSHSQDPLQPHGQLHHHPSRPPLPVPADFARHSSGSPRPHSQPLLHPVGPPALGRSTSPHDLNQQQQQQRPSSAGSIGHQRVDGQMNLLAELALSRDHDDPRQAALGFSHNQRSMPGRSSSASWHGERLPSAVEGSKARTTTLPPIAAITSMAASPSHIAAMGLGVHAPQPPDRDMRPEWLANSGFTSESPRERPGALRRSNTEKQPSAQDGGGVQLRYNVRAYSTRAQNKHSSSSANPQPASLTTRDPLPDAISHPSQRHLPAHTAPSHHNGGSPNFTNLNHPLKSVTLNLDHSEKSVAEWHEEAQHLLQPLPPIHHGFSYLPYPNPTPHSSGVTSPVKVLSPHEVHWERTGGTVAVPRDANGKLVHPPPPPAQGPVTNVTVDNRTVSGKTRRRSSDGSRKTGGKGDSVSPDVIDGQMQYRFVEVSQDELRAPYYQSRSKIDRLAAENGESQAASRISRPAGRSTEAGERDRSQGRWAPYPRPANGHHYWREEDLNEHSASMLRAGKQDQPFLLERHSSLFPPGILNAPAADSRSLQSAHSDDAMTLATPTPSGPDYQAVPSPAHKHTGDQHLPVSPAKTLVPRERRASRSASSASSQYTTDDRSVLSTQSLPASLLRQRIISPIVDGNRSRTEPLSPCSPLTTGPSPTGSYIARSHPASSVEPPLKRLRLTEGNSHDPARVHPPDDTMSQQTAAADDSLRTLVGSSQTSAALDKPQMLHLTKRERVHAKRAGPRRRAQNAKAQKKFRDKKRLAGKQMEQALHVAQMKNEVSQAKIEALERRLRELEKTTEDEATGDEDVNGDV